MIDCITAANVRTGAAIIYIDKKPNSVSPNICLTFIYAVLGGTGVDKDSVCHAEVHSFFPNDPLKK